MANISPKFFAKLLMVFQYCFQTIERIIERNHVPRFYMDNKNYWRLVSTSVFTCKTNFQ